MSNLFAYKPIDFTKEPLFLGEGRNISRLDLNIEQHIQKLTDNAVGLMWFANDFSYLEDGKDYVTLNSQQQVLFLKNLKFQQLLDSLASRSVAEVFIPITTNPQLESWWYQHAFFENNIHSKTYAEIIKALPLNAKVVFDDIMVNPNILNRAKEVISIFEECVQYNARMELNADYDKEVHKRLIVMSLYALNVLEAVLFKSSFITSFAFKENGLMTATGDAIKKIQLDEIGHYSMTINLINRLKKDPEWAYIFNDIKFEVRELYRKAIEADYNWIDYLFEDNVILLGISSSILKEYVNYNAKVVMTSVGEEPFITDVTNPCIWANKYVKSSNVQTAQKEKINANYLLGQLDTTIKTDFRNRIDYWNKPEEELT